MYKVLQDLSLAMLGYSGIPQDTRLIFKSLSRIRDVSLTGLLCEMGPGLTSKLAINRPRKWGADPQHLTLALYFGAFSGNAATRPFLRLGHWGEAIDTVVNQFRRFRMMDVPGDLYGDVIWRAFFEKTLEAEDRNQILGQSFKITNLNYGLMLQRLELPAWFSPRLDTRGYDFLITSEPRPISVSPGTVRIMRYHDPIPILHADTMGHSAPVVSTYKFTKRAARSGFFVCNSQSTEHDLVKLFPEVIGRTATIPCAVPDVRPGDVPNIGLHDIARVRLSGASIGSAIASERILAAAQIKSDTRYIMGLSTLEPRKNFEGLIRAWAKLRSQAAPDLKLVIVGRPGWRFERTLEAIRPHMLTGDLLHLQDLPVEEIRALYRRAACFVFPSLAEGFGFPPLEALQCGTPAIVSDIPTHRWVCGDAVLYCDPYDANDIAEKIRHLVAADTARALREKLLCAAQPVLKRYSIGAVSNQWEELFARLKGGDKPISYI